MKTWHILKKWLVGGCVYFTAIALVIILLNLMSENALAIAAGRFLAIFPCALVLSIGSIIWKNKEFPRWIRIIALYLIDVLAVFFFLYLPVSVAAEPITKLLMFVLMSVVFWIIFGLIALIASRIRRLMNED